VRAARLGRDKLQPALCVFDALGLECTRDVHAVARRRTHVTSVKRHERQMHTLQALPDCLYQGNITPLQEKAVMYHAYSCTPNHAPAATMLQQQHNSHLSATRLAKAKANHPARHGQDRPELGHEWGARLSSTQGRSMRMPRHCGPAQAMQRASISPRPPPTSMMLREPLHSNASSSGTCASPRRHTVRHRAGLP